MSVTFSTRFLTNLKLHPEPAYKLAIDAGMNPSSLSLMVHGGKKIDPNDPCLQHLGILLGVSPDEMFDGSQEKGRVKE